MRNMLIVCGIAGLTVAAGTVIRGEGASERAIHGPSVHGGFPGRRRPVGSHVEQMGIFFPSAPAHQFMDQLPGEPGPAPAHLSMPAGGVVVFGAEHMIAGHEVSVPIHPIEHASARAERGDSAVPQPGSASAGDSDQEGSATAQPIPPIAKFFAPRAPGAAGPGRRLVGLPSRDQADGLALDSETGYHTHHPGVIISPFPFGTAI
jgi:hypothetical protein